MGYIKDSQYYTDLYDLSTIEKCLYWENAYTSKDFIKIKDEKLNKRSFTELTLYYVKGERYKNKVDRIREWQEDDRKRQEMFDNASDPKDVYCKNCSGTTRVTYKTLEDYTNQPLRVLFFFECDSCKKRRAIYDDGKEHISKPQLCPKCSSELRTTYKESGEVRTTIDKCTSCNYSKTEVNDFEKKQAEWDKKETEDGRKLSQYREKYCLSDSEGSKYVLQTENMKQLVNMIQESKGKKENKNYQKAVKAKKLTVAELEKLFSKVLEDENYIKLSFDKPEMGKFVIVPFTVQDTGYKRKDYDNTRKLQNLLKATLETTTWRLMSEGTSYRMGYVYGRLKGYEREEDLTELFGWKKGTIQKWKSPGSLLVAKSGLSN